jgi:putative transcriptional regulator
VVLLRTRFLLVLEKIRVKNIVKQLREQHDLSQQKLADLLEVSRQTINSIENGRYDPSLPLAFKIAKHFSQTIESVFDDGA